MAKPITKTELKSSFLEKALESEEYQQSVKNIQDWLTGQTQSLQQQYQQTAQTAAEQASYDISGAYANYLKQQRGVMAQSGLESGYKQELSDVLQKQYASAYSQARTTETQTLARAASETAKLYEQANTKATTMAEQLLQQYQKQAEIKANLFKAGEEFAKQKGSEQFEWYATDDKTGLSTITPWGVEQYKSALLQFGDEFKTYLEEEELEDALLYYLANPAETHKELFGFEDTDYGVSEESKQRSKENKLKTPGYAASIEKPKYNFTYGSKPYNEEYDIITKQLTEYAEALGLTDEDTRVVLSGRPIHDVVNDFGLNFDEYQERMNIIADGFVAYSRYKYGISPGYITLPTKVGDANDYYAQEKKKEKQNNPSRIAWFDGSDTITA